METEAGNHFVTDEEYTRMVWVEAVLLFHIYQRALFDVFPHAVGMDMRGARPRSV